MRRLSAGADGYVLKSDSTTELVTAIRSLLQGKSFLSPAISRRIILGYVAARGRIQRAPEDSLTSRERQVLKLIAAGYSQSGHRRSAVAQPQDDRETPKQPDAKTRLALCCCRGCVRNRARLSRSLITLLRPGGYSCPVRDPARERI